MLGRKYIGMTKEEGVSGKSVFNDKGEGAVLSAPNLNEVNDKLFPNVNILSKAYSCSLFNGGMVWLG